MVLVSQVVQHEIPGWVRGTGYPLLGPSCIPQVPNLPNLPGTWDYPACSRSWGCCVPGTPVVPPSWVALDILRLGCLLLTDLGWLVLGMMHERLVTGGSIEEAPVCLILCSFVEPWRGQCTCHWAFCRCWGLVCPWWRPRLYRPGHIPKSPLCFYIFVLPVLGVGGHSVIPDCFVGTRYWQLECSWESYPKGIVEDSILIPHWNGVSCVAEWVSSVHSQPMGETETRP